MKLINTFIEAKVDKVMDKKQSKFNQRARAYEKKLDYLLESHERLLEEAVKKATYKINEIKSETIVAMIRKEIISFKKDFNFSAGLALFLRNDLVSEMAYRTWELIKKQPRWEKYKEEIL